MPLPWLRLIDGVLGATDLVRAVRGRGAAAAASPASSLEAPLAGVVVSALREAFHRDDERLTLDRQRLDAEQARADRALRLELLRQAGDRELARLRLLVGVAVVSLLGSLFLVTRVVGGAPSGKIALGIGWLLLVAAMAAAFSAQQQVSRILAGATPQTMVEDLMATSGGRVAPWLVVGGLATVALGVLIA